MRTKTAIGTICFLMAMAIDAATPIYPPSTNGNNTFFGNNEFKGTLTQNGVAVRTNATLPYTSLTGAPDVVTNQQPNVAAGIVVARTNYTEYIENTNNSSLTITAGGVAVTLTSGTLSADAGGFSGYGGNLTGISSNNFDAGTAAVLALAGTGDALKGASQTWTGVNTFSNTTILNGAVSLPEAWPDFAFLFNNAGTMDATLDGAALTNLNASSLASGTIPLARLSGITSNQFDSGTASNLALTRFPSASWSCSTNTRFVNVTNTITLNATEYNASGSGIYLDNSAWWTAGVGSRVWVTNRGDYLITFSAVWSKVGSTAENGDIWLRQNSVDVPRTMTLMSIPNSATNVMTVNFIVQVTNLCYFDLQGASPGGNGQLQALAAITSPFNRPACPSIIVTFNKISD